MYFNKNLFIYIFSLLSINVQGQKNINVDSTLTVKPTDSILTIQKKPLTAIGLITGTNLGIWAFDRFITQADYARINLNSIKRNLITGFVWDNDRFSTNLLAHPYNGGYYFNAARSNGMSFWQSIPFVATGSLEWELFLENEPPSINDFASTTIGGLCLGEISFRISDLFIDDRTLGFERFKREALLTIISPIRGLNRLLNGDAYKHLKIKGNTISTPPFIFYSTLGNRFMTDNSRTKNNFSPMICYDLGLHYGNPYNLENEKPYDFFSVQMSGNLGSRQPIISRVIILGMLFSKDITLRKPNQQLTFGIFQYFNYYLGNIDQNNVSLNPYKISEAASVGPGVLFKSKLTKNNLFLSSAHLGAIIMGGSQTDHYKFDKRDYNMGSGFSAKLNFEFRFGSSSKLLVCSEDYHIYSWIGNNPANGNINPNVQGDVSNTRLNVERLQFSFIIQKHILLTAETEYFYRRSNYKYYPVVSHGILDNKLSVGYSF